VKLRALLIDDNEEFLASAGRLLESQGIEVVGYAKSGEEALRLAEAHRPDLALVDIELGEEDGIALTREFEVRAPATRVVLISGYDRDDMGDLISDSSAAGYLPKSALGADAIADVLQPR
jgi:two-component system, NarL family, nitrate/nitrite response regulator NarL